MSRSAEATHQAANGGYADLVRRVRSTVEADVEPGAVVLVVGKGDPQLARLGERVAWSFPQDESGSYAGHHPADDQDAIRQLETLRARGAQYILFPRTAAWWLEHYDGFRRHLESVGRLVTQRDECRIYRLSKAVRTADEERSSPLGRQPSPARASGESPVDRQVTQLIDALLDPEMGVVIVPGETRTARVAGDRATWELEPPVHHDEPLGPWIEQAYQTGADALVVVHDEPPARHARHAFASRLRRSLRPIAHREHLCTLFALEGPVWPPRIHGTRSPSPRIG